jgi:hypothetical protein
MTAWDGITRLFHGALDSLRLLNLASAASASRV